MAALDDTHLIADPKNGVVTPIYFDRQVVRASDLTLDRESHEAALARMRRLMHGWGVVSGFVPNADGDTVYLSPGYGVAPSGAEIFLPDAVELGDMFDRIMETCGLGAPGCELISEQAKSQAMAELALASVSIGAWLIARPASDEAEPRPGVPEGCGHPGNVLLASRRCHIVQLELICTLPSDKLMIPQHCGRLDPYMCGHPATGNIWPVPYPEPPQSADDFIVIGYIGLSEEGLLVDLHHRRTVMSTSMLQDWMQSCLCPIVNAPTPVIVEETTPVEPDEPDEPDTPDKPVTGSWGIWDEYIYGQAEYRGERFPDGTRAEPLIDEALAEQIPYLAGELSRLYKLGDLGIDGPEQFLQEDIKVLVAATGLPSGSIMKMKEELVSTSERWQNDAVAPIVSSTWGEFNEKMTGVGVSSVWAVADGAPATGTTSTPPLVTSVVGSPEEMEAKGIAGPAEMLAKTDAELAFALGITDAEAGAMKTDIMRFVPIMSAKGMVG